MVLMSGVMLTLLHLVQWNMMMC